MNTRQVHLSRTLVAVCAAAVLLGIIMGAIDYGNRESDTVKHVAGTSAWGIHLGLTVVALVWIGAATRWAWLRPPAPLAAECARRVGQLCRHHRRLRLGRLRLATLTVLSLLCWYLLWRMGEQIVGGLNPDFTANAWGGPSYFGAMYCHYLDCSLMIAASIMVIDRLFPRGQGSAGHPRRWRATHTDAIAL